MDKLNQIISQNLVEMRKANNLTQKEFGDKLGYSDKTVSKWELGYAIPDVKTLKEIADFYNVYLDYFIKEHATAKILYKGFARKYQIMIMGLVDLFFMSVSCIVYVAVISFTKYNVWPLFLYGAAISFLFNAIMSESYKFKPFCGHLFATLTIWTLLGAIYASLITANIEYNFWYLFLVGLPIQFAAIIILGLQHARNK